MDTPRDRTLAIYRAVAAMLFAAWLAIVLSLGARIEARREIADHAMISISTPTPSPSPQGGGERATYAGPPAHHGPIRMGDVR